MRLLLLASLCGALPLAGQPSSSRVPKDALPPILLPWDSEVHTRAVDNGTYPGHKVAGNLYYVGTAGYASFLITSSAGHILINPNFEDSVPLIQKSIESLGFRFQDVKIVLISHAHGDHCAGTARMKEFTGAQVMVMDRDVETMETGGKGSFPPVKVSRTLHDKDEVTLGGNRLVAHLTPGHTRGNTTWTLKVEDGGKSYNVVILGSAGVNDARDLFNKTYPDVIPDYLQTFRVLRELPCDIFLASHGKFYGLESKFPKLGKGDGNPFIDPAGSKAHVDLMEKAFYYKMDWAKRGN